MKRACGISALVMAILAASGSASGATVLRASASSEAIDRPCTDRPLAGAFSRTVEAPSLSAVRATLSGGGGDWDLAVFDADTDVTVAGSAFAATDEVAQGFAFEGERLLVQACRRPGARGSPRLELELEPIDADEPAPAPALLRVSTPTDADKDALQRTGLDLTESAGDDFVDVVAYGRGDREALARAGLAYTTRVADLTRQSARARAAEARAPAAAAAAAADRFPSGRSGTYRRLFDYSEELKQLAEEHPRIVRPITLPHETYEGRPVEGIEITRRPRVPGGKPVFLQLGVHHAREWPSGEHALEWAYELIEGVESGDRRARRLVRRTRTIVVPIVNPDGFNTSREAGELQGAAAGRGGSADQETINILTHPYEYRRKNCRLLDDSPAGDCTQPSVGLAEPGVDPNRNYGGFWGGPGASTDPIAQDYRGPGPFSEPETENIRWLIGRRQVIALITNHTFTGLVLRPPGIASQGAPPDERILKRLGARMADENGYVSQPAYELYDTTGSTEDWAYYATGALGYTFEIGPTNFHPPFAETVAEWTGDTELAGDGGGNRAAYYHAAELAAEKRHHAVIKGKGPKRGRIVLKKSFMTPTSPVIDSRGVAGAVRRFKDRLRTVTRIRRGGKFKIHANPSTRPLVAESRGERNAGPPSDPTSFSGQVGTTTPCADFDTEDAGCFNDHPLTVPDDPDRSNATATVRIEWATPASDWDLKVFRDSDGDGSSAGETDLVASSGNAPSTFEEAAIGELEPGEEYVVRVINYLAVESYEGTVTFAAPEPYVAARKERWTLVCKNRKGKRTGSRKLYVERGDLKKLDLRRGCGRRG